MEQPLRYTNGGKRLAYHPDFHPNQGKPWTTRELAYLCYHYETTRKMDLGMDMGRTQTAIMQKKLDLTKDGSYEELKKFYREHFFEEKE